MSIGKDGKLSASSYVFITIIVTLGIIGLAAEIGITLIMVLVQSQELVLRVCEGAGLAAVPLTVVKGIEMVIKRITYTPTKSITINKAPKKKKR